jgi:hypothetical protein
MRSATAALFAAAACASTPVAAQAPSGWMDAAIQTPSGNYLTVVNGGGLGGPDNGPEAVALHTDARAAGPWETFNVIWLNTTFTKFALQTSGGEYVTAVNGGGIGGPNDASSPVHTDAVRIAAWERLRLDFLPNHQVTIKLPGRRFLTAVNGGGIGGPNTAPIHTDASQHGAWETFTLVKLHLGPGGWPTPAPGPAPAPDPEPSPAPTPPALARLDAATGVHWILMDNRMLITNGRPAPSFTPGPESKALAIRAAQDFLSAYRDLWPIVDPRQELRLDRYTASDGFTVVFNQLSGGLPVFGSTLLLSFDREGRLALVNGNYLPDLPQIDKTPRLSASQAVAAAQLDLSAGGGPAESAVSRAPVLGIETAPEHADSIRLAYRLALDQHEYVIDAQTGAVIGRGPIMELTIPVGPRQRWPPVVN